MEFERELRPPNATYPQRATVQMESGEYLTVHFKDASGKEQTFEIMAQHLVFMVEHKQTEAFMQIRPGGVTYIPPAPKERVGS